MLNATILFSNLFRSNKITALRLLLFGRAVLACLATGNDRGQFTAIIVTLTAALNALHNELSGVDINLNDQKTDTKVVDAFILDFARYMNDREPFIAEALGGRDSEGYLALYPGKPGEYSRATKTTMPVLTLRVHEAAVKWATGLGTVMAAKLQGFAAGYNAAQDNQEDKKSSVTKARGGRSLAFEQAQLTLTTTVFTVAAQYPGDVPKCASFFPFSLLYSQRRRSRYKVNGTLAHGETRELLNRNISKTAVVNVKNTSDNSPLVVWLAASPAGEMPGNAVVIEAGADKDLKATSLGDLKNTFFMAKNTSSINDGTYEVTFIGLKKASQPKVKAAKKGEKMKVVKEDAA